MTIRTFALACLPLLLAAPAFAEDMTCATFGPDTTLAQIEQKYGKANVVTGDVDGPEGTTMVATTVFPKDEEKSFEVYWFDEEKHERLSGFTVPQDGTGPGGIKIGMAIKDVEKINGKVFKVGGFYWDYGGGANFEGGKLENVDGACFLGVTFAPSVETTSQKIGDAISGEKELKSNMKEFAVVKPVIQSINLGYPDPQASEENDGSDGGDVPQ
jgi:hypothetical protein